MAPRQDTLFERFLAPVFRLIVDREAIQALHDQIDWDAVRQKASATHYPDYYQTQHFHGIEGGYLNPQAAITYDAITQHVLPPNELWVRQALVSAIPGQPRRILDLGCGTGSTTLLLKQAFPQAEVIGLDLSPYMLAVAAYKSDRAGQFPTWQQGNAEDTGLPAGNFDLVTATLLFHETPPAASQSILREAYRLLMPGGSLLVLDGNQQTLRQMDWLTQIFEEPYIQAYAAQSLDAWLGAAGFETVRTESIWWVHQLTVGMKPLPITEAAVRSSTENWPEALDLIPSLG